MCELGEKEEQGKEIIERERGGGENECLINNEHNLLLNLELELTVYIKILFLNLSTDIHYLYLHQRNGIVVDTVRI